MGGGLTAILLIGGVLPGLIYFWLIGRYLFGATKYLELRSPSRTVRLYNGQLETARRSMLEMLLSRRRLPVAER
jgi:hypothetical protein